MGFSKLHTVGGAIFSLLFLSCPALLCGQVLDRVRSEVHGDAPASPSANAPAENKTNHGQGSSNSQANNSVDSPNDLTLDDPVGFCAICAAGITSPFWGPPMILKDNQHPDGYFPRYPYADTVPGSMEMESQYLSRFRSFSGHFSMDAQSDFDTTTRYGGRLLLSTRRRLDFDSQWNWLSEKRSLGNDHLQVGDLNVVYRFAQSEQIQMRTGLGMNWLYDADRFDAGFNFTYSGDFYPIRPWLFSTKMDLGTIGHTTQFHLRATTGVSWHRLGVFGGYDYRTIGSARIAGPVVGLDWYF